MRGRIERCWLFTHSIPMEHARALLPARLEPITLHGRAFSNIVVCELSRMRPAGLPAWAGLLYRHAAYRIYVQFDGPRGRVGGLYFTRSDSDSRLIASTGNLLTAFEFHRSPIVIEESDIGVRLDVRASDAPGHAVIDRQTPPSRHPVSAFESLEQAATFLKYEPAGISVQRDGKINVVRIVRREEEWRSRLVHVAEQNWSLLPPEAVPEVCYELEPIDYQWNRAELFP